MSRDYIPALRFSALTPWYDRVVAWTTRDAALKERLVELVALRSGEQLLDLGCGTGTFMLALAGRGPDAELTGVDADRAILALAAAKTQAAGVTARLIPGRSEALALADASFDVAVSSLFFHHLQPDEKRQTVRELYRVLRPGGRLIVADFGRASARWRRTLFSLVQLLDGYPNTRDHAAGKLASYFREGGFVELQCLDPLPVLVGSIDFLLALKPFDS